MPNTEGKRWLKLYRGFNEGRRRGALVTEKIFDPILERGEYYDGAEMGEKFT